MREVPLMSSASRGSRLREIKCSEYDPPDSRHSRLVAQGHDRQFDKRHQNKAFSDSCRDEAVQKYGITTVRGQGETAAFFGHSGGLDSVRLPQRPIYSDGLSAALAECAAPYGIQSRSSSTSF
jgi:hypothetical protein